MPPARRGRGRPRKKRTSGIKKYIPKSSNYTLRLSRLSNASTTSGQFCHQVIVGTAAGNSLGSTVFTLSNVPNYNELRNLFDNYRISKVLYRWVLIRDPSAYQTTAGTQGLYPRLTWVHDFNDSTPLARDQLMQYPKMREFFFGDNNQKTKWFAIKPAILKAQYNGVLAASYSPAWMQFMDTNYYDTPHYGIKYAWSNLYEGNQILLEAKIIYDFKGIS